MKIIDNDNNNEKKKKKKKKKKVRIITIIIYQCEPLLIFVDIVLTTLSWCTMIRAAEENGQAGRRAQRPGSLHWMAQAPSSHQCDSRRGHLEKNRV